MIPPPPSPSPSSPPSPMSVASSRSRLAVAVFGSAIAAPGDSLWDLAERTGRALARAGFDLINGGYGGTMEASALGAKEGGAHVLGVTVSRFTRSPNPHNSEIIHAQTLFERLDILLRRGDAYLVLPGGTGTLVELALAVELANKEFDRPRPLIMLGNFWKPALDCALGDPREPNLHPLAPSTTEASSIVPPRQSTPPRPPEVSPEAAPFLHWVRTPEEAAALLQHLLR